MIPSLPWIVTAVALAAAFVFGTAALRGSRRVRILNGGLDAIAAEHARDVEALRARLRDAEVASQVLAAERESGEAVLRSMADAVVLVNPFGEVVSANPAAERLFGFRLRPVRLVPRGSASGGANGGERKGESSHGAGADVAARRLPLEQAIRSPRIVEAIRGSMDLAASASRRSVEVPCSREGAELALKLGLTTLKDDDGVPAGVVCVFHDVTHERELDRLKTDFIAAVSHELKTPLASIKAYTEMLVDGDAETEDQQKGFFAIILEQSDRLARLIGDLLNISRIEAGMAVVRREPLSLPEIVRKALATLDAQTREKRLHVVVELSPYTPTLHGDREMISQAVSNLIGNAVKYTRPDGRVAVRSALEGDRVAIEVEDSGIGIAEKDLPRLFDRFFRTKESSEMAPGTGVGLALTKRMLEMHEGTVEVSSEQGKGTTVRVTLPVQGGAMVTADRPA